MADQRQLSIVAKWVDNVSAGANKTASSISAFMGKAGGAVKQTMQAFTSLKAVIVGVGTALVAGRVVSSLNALAEGAGKVNAQARGLGITTESLSELAFAFDQVNGSAEDAAPALGRLSKVIGQINQGDNDEARRALRDLGIDLQAIEKAKPDELLFDIADGLRALNDETQAADIAARIFGRGIAEKVVPTLIEGRDQLMKARLEARELGISLSSDAAKRLDAYADAWSKLKKTIQATFTSAIADNVDSVTSALSGLSDWIAKNKDLVNSAFTGFANTITVLAKTLVYAVGTLNAMGAQFGGELAMFADIIRGDTHKAVRPGALTRDVPPEERERRFAEMTGGAAESGTQTAPAKERMSDLAKTFDDFASGFKRKMRELVDGWTDFAKAGEDAAERIVGGGFDKLVDTLSDITLGLEKPKEAFRKFGMVVVTELNKVIIRLALVKAFQAAIGGIGSLFAGSQAGYDASTAADVRAGVDFAKGGVMRGAMSPPVKAYGYGGVARSPQLALFGEGRQAEAFVPLPDGRSIPVSMQGRGGGGTTVNLHINAIDGPSVMQFFQTHGKTLWRAVASGIGGESNDLRQAVRSAVA